MEEMPGECVMGDLNGRGKGVIGVMSGTDKISLHAGALTALQEHADGMYPGMKVALASSANTPFAVKIGRASLAKLEVLPGLTVWDLLMRDWDGRDVNQIGRSPPLSPNKAATHFPLLREATGIGFDKMLVRVADGRIKPVHPTRAHSQRMRKLTRSLPLCVSFLTTATGVITVAPLRPPAKRPTVWASSRYERPSDWVWRSGGGA